MPSFEYSSSYRVYLQNPMEPPDVSGQGEALQMKNFSDGTNKSEALNSLI